MLIKKHLQSGFTLIEVSIVLLIVTILLGYTVALFPIQQDLKKYRKADDEMNRVLEAIIGFAQTNGRLPCPSLPATLGLESGGGVTNCSRYGGFVPVNTLGITGDINVDLLLLDPWGNPYRYYVSDNDFDGDGLDDFVRATEMRSIGLVDSNADDYIDLDGTLVICDGASTDADECAGSSYVFGLPDTSLTPPVYKAAPVVLLSMGKNWADTPIGDELENRGSTEIVNDWGETAGPSGNDYFIDTDWVFVKRTSGMASNFDDLVKWISPSALFSKMIQAGQLP